MLAKDLAQHAPAPGARSRRQAYRYFGFDVHSDFQLPELPSAQGRSEGEPLQVIRGDPCAAGDLEAAPLLIRGSLDELVLSIPALARFRIEGARSITVEPLANAAPEAVRLFLLGSAFGIALHQRGLLPLHANAVAKGGKVYAFAGDSGAGKSTLAGFFARDGWGVFSDDVCALDVRGGRAPLIHAGAPRLKLWADAARALHHDPATLHPVVAGAEKFNVALMPTDADTLPLSRLYLLERSPAGAVAEIVRLRGERAMHALLTHTYRREYLPALGLGVQNFEACAQVARQIPVYRVSRRWDLAAMEREFALLRQHVLHDHPEDHVPLAPTETV